MKTIEEGCKYWRGEIACNQNYSEWDEINKAFRAGAEFAQRWIPVEDELPDAGWEHKNLVLIKGFYTDDKYGMLDFIRVSRVRSIYEEAPIWAGITQTNKEKTHTVTHWRPIELG